MVQVVQVVQVSGKSLLNEETWRKINVSNKYELRPAFRGFQAVNGSRINCLGSAVVQLMLMGEDKNYIAYFQFYIVDSLSVDALLGIDEIFRHNLRINTKDGFVRQDNVGKLLSNIIYRTQYDIGSVKTDENIKEDNKDQDDDNDQDKAINKPHGRIRLEKRGNCERKSLCKCNLL